jgi:membrane protein implicated in regulation of membrane protease activity
VIGLIVLIFAVGNIPSDLWPGLFALGFIAVVPGVAYLVMGWWYQRKAKRQEEVVQPKLRDYGVIFLQLLPGVFLSAAGILISKIAPDLVDALGPDYLNWLVLALATLTSVVVVRRVRDKA